MSSRGFLCFLVFVVFLCYLLKYLFCIFNCASGREVALRVGANWVRECALVGSRGFCCFFISSFAMRFPES